MHKDDYEVMDYVQKHSAVVKTCYFGEKAIIKKKKNYLSMSEDVPYEAFEGNWKYQETHATLNCSVSKQGRSK